MIDNKNNFKKVAIVAAITAATTLASMSTFSATHPKTGEELATDQSFTYRLLDGLPSLDPQLVEAVDSSNVVRDLFEGLLNQDELGNNVPGVATSYDLSEDKKLILSTYVNLTGQTVIL